MKLQISIALVAVLTFAGSGAARTASSEDWAGRALAAPGGGPSSTPEITSDDLLRLRDLGGISVSPDGKNVAFSVRQADASTNRYYLRFFVAPVDGSAPPTDLGLDGGQPIPAMLYGLPYAYIPTEYIKWSPDGRYVAVRRMEGHRIELWMIGVASRRAIRVADGSAQVDAFAWDKDGALIFRTGLDYEKFDAERAAEARHGFLWDSRISHYASYMYPTIPECGADSEEVACRNEIFSYRPGAFPQKATSVEGGVLTSTVGDARLRSDGATVRAMILDPRFKDAITPVRRLTTDAAGSRACATAACTGSRFRAYGWTKNGTAIWFVKSESDYRDPDGAPGEDASLYLWNVRSGNVRRIHRIQGWLDDCKALERTVVCIEETPTIPRRVVAIDLTTAVVSTIADPNPSFSKKTFPKIQGMYLKDRYGGPYFAQLIYPANYTPGHRYPLVIVQYGERGFLRGQVGGEYPIYPFANAGFAVLSINWNRPPSKLTTTNIENLNRQYSKDGREVVKEVIDSAVDRLVADGVADPKKIAITGLSAGAEMVNYMLQRSDRFAAAIASSAAQDLTFFALVPEGPARTRLMWEFGTDSLIPSPGSSIYDISWTNKPERLETPLLVNVGEHEAMTGFEGFEAIKHAGGPLEVRVFPDEQHVKYHPQSYAGVFENNMQWLRFWLLNQEDPRPEFSGQYARWRHMAAMLRRTKR